MERNPLGLDEASSVRPYAEIAGCGKESARRPSGRPTRRGPGSTCATTPRSPVRTLRRRFSAIHGITWAIIPSVQ